MCFWRRMRLGGWVRAVGLTGIPSAGARPLRQIAPLRSAIRHLPRIASLAWEEESRADLFSSPVSVAKRAEVARRVAKRNDVTEGASAGRRLLSQGHNKDS